MLVEHLVDLDRRRVQAGLVRERRGAGVRLTSLRRLVGDLGDGVGDPGEVAQRLRLDERPAELELEVPDEGHEVGVARTFAVPVHRALDVHGARLDGGDRVGHGAARVVVAVDAKVDPDRRSGAHHFAHPARKHAAVGVAEDDHFGARLRRGADHVQRVLRVAAVAVEEVLGIDEDTLALGLEVRHGVAHHAEVLLQRGAQGVGDVTVVRLGDDADDGRLGVDKGLYERVLGRLHADPGGHAERHERRVLERETVRGLGEERRVVRVRARPATLDERHTELVEQRGDPQLVGHR